MPAVRLSEIVTFVSGRYSGPDVAITGVAPLSEATEQHISFLSNPKYAPQLESTNAAAVLVANDLEGDSPKWIRVANPYYAMATTVARFFAQRPRPDGISPHTAIAQSAKLGRNVAVGAFTSIGDDVAIGDDVVIYPNVTIEPGVVIGDGTIIYPQVSIYYGCKIGKRCILHSGVVIGADGFGFATDDTGTHHKIPQVGIVRIEDDVEIGAGTTIDRAALGETVVGAGTKIDNLVQIGHNVRIGQRVLLVAQAGIAGSTQLGDDVQVGGQSGFAGHLKIGDRVRVYSKSAVFDDVPAGVWVRGIPAVSQREYVRQQRGRKK
ncbi:MAG TPA: UDP-3-O-(3-hydroxymyristoyl)glucosamine N-acyltransferase [Thermoanaerobaculia bacterium]|jgi:UDP-3-O-[3-hydroxymyristoyl] glucosamine N-acyltransferase|nr:UDP-3-O-(3-hydroxymyristoyl)glucosamine N-acyltransferase [Thermoanaerobaculia bacterium]